jgi:hypothetical protein
MRSAVGQYSRGVIPFCCPRILQIRLIFAQLIRDAVLIITLTRSYQMYVFLWVIIWAYTYLCSRPFTIDCMRIFCVSHCDCVSLKTRSSDVIIVRGCQLCVRNCAICKTEVITVLAGN